MKNMKSGCFDNNKKYSKFELGLDLDKIQSLTILNEKKTYFAYIFLVAIFFIIIFVSINLTKINYLFYLPCIFIIAGRQGAMVQLVHEASHHLISKNHKLNDFFGSYLCSYPIGVNFVGFRQGHNNHHVNTATENDSPTDLDKYKDVNVKGFGLYKLFLKDLVGISALEVFLSYGKIIKKKQKRDQEN